MDNFTDQEDVGTPAQHSAPQVESPDTSPAPDATPRPETAPSVQRHSASTAYVRSRPAHRTQPPIDDYASDSTSEESVTHDSSITTGGNVFSGRSYRRARSEMPQLRRDLHYGQYLEIPKGRRDIFASRERRTHVRSIIALLIVIAILVVVVLIVWQYMQTNWGATS